MTWSGQIKDHLPLQGEAEVEKGGNMDGNACLYAL